jgi:hypothetical protein
MRFLVAALVLLAAFVWSKSDRNDCEIHGMSTQQWLTCLIR